VDPVIGSTTPVVILAGVDYTGVPTAQWVSHVRLAIEEAIQDRRRQGTPPTPVRWSPRGTAAKLSPDWLP